MKRHLRISRIIELAVLVILTITTIGSAVYYIITDNINIMTILYVAIQFIAVINLGKIFFTELK